MSNDSFMRYINAVADGDDIEHQIACGDFDPCDFPWHKDDIYEEEPEEEDSEPLNETPSQTCEEFQF